MAVLINRKLSPPQPADWWLRLRRAVRNDSGGFDTLGSPGSNRVVGGDWGGG